MTPFELAIARTISVYDAGVAGRSCPYYPGMRVQDIERVYSEGRLDGMAELERAHERGDIHIDVDVVRLIADCCVNQAAKAARR